MNDQLRAMTDLELEAALGDLAASLAPSAAFGPDGGDLARAVRLRIEASGAIVPGRPRLVAGSYAWRARRTRRGLLLALAALLLLAGIAAAIGLGLPGLRIVVEGPSPTPSATAPGRSPVASPSPVPTPAPLPSLGLGRPVDRTQADAALGRHVLLPTLPELGPPGGIYLLDEPPRLQASITFGPRPGFPAGPGTTVAILVTEFGGSLEQGYLQKGIGPGSAVEPLTVGGHRGFWISGTPHDLFYVRPDGSVDTDSIRLAGNVLAWSDGELTFRIEGAADLATALRIADSMR
jgi:hypothetical protein